MFNLSSNDKTSIKYVRITFFLKQINKTDIIVLKKIN